MPRSTKEDVAVAVLDLVQELRVAGGAPLAGGTAPVSPEPRAPARTRPSRTPMRSSSAASRCWQSSHWAQAAVSLEKAKRLEPDKTSIREALGRAYFRSGRYRRAASEFSAVVERYPANDYAHFCLGRSLREARRPRPPPAGTSRSPPACAPTATTTASTATA